MEPEDLDITYETENDPSMRDISSFIVPYSRFMPEQYIEGSQSDMPADKQLRLMIVHRNDNRALGTVDITNFVPLHSRGAVGIAIRRDYRQEGYTVGALKLLCGYAFNLLFVKQLYVHIAIDNEASLRLSISCGFTQCGVLKDWLPTHEGYKDAVFVQCMNPKR